MRYFVLSCLVLALLIGGGFWLVKQWGLSETDPAVLEKQLLDADAQVRMRAATELLELSPDHAAARLVLAAIYFETGRPRMVIDTLDPLLRGEGEAGAAAVKLAIPATVMEAEMLARDLSPLVLERTLKQLDDLEKLHAWLFEAITPPQAEGTRPAPDPQRQISEARLLLVRMQTDQLSLRINRDQTEMATVGGIYERLGELRTQRRVMETRYNRREAQWKDLCRQIEARGGVDADWVARMRVRHAFVLGQPQVALQLAEAWAAKPNREREAAAEVILMLLDHPDLQFGAMGDRVIRLGRKLLDPEQLNGDASLLTLLAEAQLALRDYQPQVAHDLAQQVLRQHPVHPRARLIRGRALIGIGRAHEAINLLDAYRREHPTAEAHWALGQAYLASQRNINQGLEILTRAAELNDRHLPIQISLATALQAHGQLPQARGVVRKLIEQAPSDPRVEVLSAGLALIDGDSGPLSDLFLRLGAEGQLLPRASTAVLVAAMAIDDVPLAGRALAGRSGSHDSAIEMLAEGWQHHDPLTRAQQAGPIARAVEAAVLAKVMDWPGSPANPAHDVRRAFEQTRTLQSADPDTLRYSVFLRRPHDQAATVIDWAQGYWPDDPMLHEAAAALALWSGDRLAARRHVDALWSVPHTQAASTTAHLIRDYLQGLTDACRKTLESERDIPLRSSTSRLIELLLAMDEDATDRAAKVLETLLRHHPRAEAAAIWALHDAMRRRQLDHAETWVRVVRAANADLAQVIECRLLVTIGEVETAMRRMTALQQHTWGDREVRRSILDANMAATVLAGKADRTAWYAQGLRGLSKHESLELRMASLDAMLLGRHPGAGDAAESLLADFADQPAVLDLVLGRLDAWLKPQEVLALLERVTARRPLTGPTVLWHKARQHERMGDTQQAGQVLRLALAENPDAPRLRWAVANLAELRGEQQQAAQAYADLAAEGGPVAREAARRLQRLGLEAASTAGNP